MVATKKKLKNKKSSRGIFNRVSEIKQPEALAEIGRAHLIIALLSGCLIMSLLAFLRLQIAPAGLINTAAVLVGLIGLFSMLIWLSILSKRMK